MKIFNAIQLATGKIEIQQFQVDPTADHIQMQIQRLKQMSGHDETVLMAEHTAENHIVLTHATTHWFGYGLYHPELKQLDQKYLHIQCPKIILLEPNDPDAAFFAHVRHVVFNFEEYQHLVKQLLSWIPPLGDGD